MKNRSAFTLIELLVVVLIIGILAAVALPQYQKAVWRSRNAELKQLLKTVAQAEQAYYLANGKYAGNFNELDIDLPLSAPGSSVTGNNAPCDLATRGSDGIRRGKNFDIVLNVTDLNTNMSPKGMWTGGPYKCAGFAIPVSTMKMHCLEVRNGTYTNTNGAFCEKIEHGSLVPNTGTGGNTAQYSLQYTL